MQENTPPKRTELSSLGEFGLIDRIAANTVYRQPSTIHGIGDDAAVIDTGTDEYLLISSDMLTEGVHFDLSYTPLHHLGYKAVAVNVSDIAAMNGTPTQITVSLGLSNRFSVEAVDAIYKGIHAACEHYAVDLAGGDTVSSHSGLVISVTAIGKVVKNRLSLRSGAKKGDILCVSGDLGGAYLGLQVLVREKKVLEVNSHMTPELEERSYVVGRQLKPEARTDLVYELAELGVVPTSMIDISDGLASEVLHLCKSSSLGAVIYEDKIPIAQESYQVAIDDFKLTPSICALNGGEDYELLFSIAQADYEKIKHLPDIAFVGYMHEAQAGHYLISSGGSKVPLQAQGWVAF